MSKVSIVVPCFNQETFILDALKSVLAQTYKDWECIIVDDGSTDDSAVIIQNFIQNQTKFTCIKKVNGGVSSARNLGFAQATGDYFLPLDGDDKLHPKFLQEVMTCFSNYPQTDLVHCGTRLFGAKNKLWRLPSYTYEKLLWKNMIVNSSVFRKEAFSGTTGYSEEMVHGFEDWEFYIRLLNPNSQVRFIDSSLFFYRVKNTSRSTRQFESGMAEESMRQIHARNKHVYEQFNENPIAVFSNRMNDFAPMYTARYRRQIAYIHAAYLLLIAALVGLLFL